MKFNIYPYNKTMTLNGVTVDLPNFDWSILDSAIEVIHWDDVKGIVQYSDHRGQIVIKDITFVQSLVAAHGVRITEIDGANPNPTLDELKKQAKWSVDYQAGKMRTMFVTHAPLQSLVYQRKKEEYVAYLADQDDPDNHPERYPHIAVEAQVTSQTFAQVAATYQANDQLWSSLSAQIEGLRLAAKIAIDAASDEDGVNAAANVNWASLGVGVPDDINSS